MHRVHGEPVLFELNGKSSLAERNRRDDQVKTKALDELAILNNVGEAISLLH